MKCKFCGKATAKSGYLGVYVKRVKKNTYYSAVLDGEYLGNFRTPREAAERYDAEVKKRYGPEAQVNFD